MASKKIIRVEGVSKEYAHGDTVESLDGVSFDVRQGEFLSIVGPSGCGKTTLLKIIGGLLTQTAGEVRISGGRVEEAVAEKRLGFVFQNPVLFPWRTTLENVKLPLEILGIEETSHTPEELLDLVGLSKFANTHPWRLSRGMQGRASIAQALAVDPEILLMDEPFSGLDEITRYQMDLELLRVWEAVHTTLSTVVFVTHSIPEAVFLSDRVVVLSERPGRLKAVVDVKISRPRSMETRGRQEFFEAIKCVREKLLNG